MVDFNVEAIDAVHIDATGPITECDLMSPYVWEDGDGSLAMLVRATPKSISETGNTGSIFYGTGADGLSFAMQANPAIAPGPGVEDIGGCEVPTVLKWQGRYIVYYTGVDETRASGSLMYASGPSIDQLEKSGVALRSTKSQGNTKEATIARTADGRWRLFYEFARDGASLVGLALGEGIAGPWHERPAPFSPRPERWDNWHLSTGPMLTDDPDMPVMFYNGATADARWRIGWVAFNRNCTKVVQRCIVPMIVPPPPLEDRNAIDIAFAASVVVRGGQIYLYYSLADKSLFRATIRRS